MDPKTKCQRIILEAFYKICDILLESRGFFDENDVEQRRRRRRRRSSRNNCIRKPHPSFNLIVDSKPVLRNALREWKTNPHRILYIHIYFEQPLTKKKFLLERYTLEYRPRGSRVDEKTSQQLRSVYKKISVFLRSFISFVRIVPAFDISREHRKQISYDVSSDEESQKKKHLDFDCVVSNMRFSHIVAPFGMWGSGPNFLVLSFDFCPISHQTR